MIFVAIDFLTIVSLMVVGRWLEGIGGKHGLFDEILTPAPLGLGGLLYIVLERTA